MQESLGYELERKALALPKCRKASKAKIYQIASQLKPKLEKILMLSELSSEIARRELLIAPLIIEVVQETEARLSIEYNLSVSEHLKGTLDYFLRQNGNIFLVIEAKLADLTRGFKQLVAELVALQQWFESDRPIYGAVSIGDVWQFAVLIPGHKRIEQDLNLYRVPADLEQLLEILVGVLMRI